MAKYFMICFTVLLLLVSCKCAPKRSKKGEYNGPHTVYDQKQNGDYNIQVHLKDFQIIALLGDEVSLGDYDYAYDYSDFTNKPISQKPTEPSISSTTSLTSETSNISTQPSSPYPFDQSNPILIGSEASKPETNASIETEKPASTDHPIASETANVIVSSIQTLVLDKNPDLENTDQLLSNKSSTTSSISTTPKSAKFDDPGKIKVQIIETPVRMDVVPGEDIGQKETLPSGDILQIRKCAVGFNRDKRGRCRRVRKPAIVQQHVPFGFSRLASSLASRFRPTAVGSSDSSSESKED